MNGSTSCRCDLAWVVLRHPVEIQGNCGHRTREVMPGIFECVENDDKNATYGATMLCRVSICRPRVVKKDCSRSEKPHFDAAVAWKQTCNELVGKS